MSDHRLTALIMLLVCGLLLLFGVGTGGQGYWDRERHPLVYWSTMILWGLMAVMAACGLVAG